jgi:hypothetical protein
MVLKGAMVKGIDHQTGGSAFYELLCLRLLNGTLKYSWGAMNQIALKSLPL